MVIGFRSMNLDGFKWRQPYRHHQDLYLGDRTKSTTMGIAIVESGGGWNMAMSSRHVGTARSASLIKANLKRLCV